MIAMTKVNSFENIINKSDSLDELSRDIIAFFSTNNKFDEKLADNNSPECQLFNLSMQYLDTEKSFEREETGRKLEELIASYKVHLE